MKKYFILTIFAFGTVTLTSCSNECCTVNTVEVCEDDYVDVTGTISWADYKVLVEASGQGTCN